MLLPNTPIVEKKPPEPEEPVSMDWPEEKTRWRFDALFFAPTAPVPCAHCRTLIAPGESAYRCVVWEGKGRIEIDGAFCTRGCAEAAAEEVYQES